MGFFNINLNVNLVMCECLDGLKPSEGKITEIILS